jgi:hypothetical protein
MRGNIGLALSQITADDMLSVSAASYMLPFPPLKTAGA